MYTHAFVEFLGTALIIGTFAFTRSPILVVAALAIALGLGGSGGHFNPAITSWALATGAIGTQRAMMYYLAQYSAGLLVFMVGSILSV